MLGLSAKEKLMDLVKNACDTNISVYEQTITKMFDMYDRLVKPNANGMNEDELLGGLVLKARQYYLDAVAHSVVTFFSNLPPKIYMRFTSYIANPSACGLDDYDTEKGIAAGALYHMCYYAYKGKAPAPQDCVSLNHYQYKLMDKVLENLSNN